MSFLTFMQLWLFLILSDHVDGGGLLSLLQNVRNTSTYLEAEPVLTGR